MCINLHSLFGFNLQWKSMHVIFLRICEGNFKINETYKEKRSENLSFIKNAKNLYYIPDIKFLSFIFLTSLSPVSTNLAPSPQMQSFKNIEPVYTMLKHN